MGPLWSTSHISCPCPLGPDLDATTYTYTLIWPILLLTTYIYIHKVYLDLGNRLIEVPMEGMFRGYVSLYL